MEWNVKLAPIDTFEYRFTLDSTKSVHSSKQWIFTRDSSLDVKSRKDV